MFKRAIDRLSDKPSEAELAAQITTARIHEASSLTNGGEWEAAAAAWASLLVDETKNVPPGAYARQAHCLRKLGRHDDVLGAVALAKDNDALTTPLILEATLSQEEASGAEAALQMLRDHLHVPSTPSEVNDLLREAGRIHARSGNGTQAMEAVRALFSVSTDTGPSELDREFAAWAERLALRSASRDAWHDYWRRRKDYVYLQIARKIIEVVAPSASVVADVGSNRSPILDYYGPATTRYSVDIEAPYEAPGITSVRQDFLQWTPPHPVQVGSCLQVIEHVPDPAAFCRRMLETCEVSIVSVPYKEPPGRNPGHINTDIDEAMLEGWFGRRPNFSYIAKELSGDERIVCVYDRESETPLDVFHSESSVAAGFRHRWSKPAQIADFA